MFCKNCGKEIENSSQFCKYCGTRIEENTSEDLRRSRIAPTEDVPSYDIPQMIPLDMMEKHEKTVFETHPSLFIVFLKYSIFAIPCIVIGLRLLFDSDNDYKSVGIIFIIFGLVLVLLAYLTWRSKIYGLTTNRAIKLTGIFGKNLYETRLNKIQDIRMKFNFIQRIIGCGDIFITTAGTAGIECLWQDIPNPRQKQKLLRTLFTS